MSDKRDDEHALAVLAGRRWCELHQRAHDTPVTVLVDALWCGECLADIDRLKNAMDVLESFGEIPWTTTTLIEQKLRISGCPEEIIRRKPDDPERAQWEALVALAGPPNEP